MRFGLVLKVDDQDRPLPGLVDQAVAAEEAGFDLVWIDGAMAGVGGSDPLVLAAALASHTTDLRVGACCPVGSTHPAYVAEAAAVADLALAGRLVLGLRPEPDTDERFDEVVELVSLAHRTVPFAYHGRFWTMPAVLGGNRFGVHPTTAVTPAPAQLQLPLWVAGSGTVTAAVAAAHGVGMVADPDEPTAAVAQRWAQVEARLGAAARRLARVAGRRLDATALTGQDLLTEPDIDALVAGLQLDQQQWAADTVLVALPDAVAPAARRQLIGQLASRVRPRLVLPDLPPGLVEHWRSQP